MYLKTGIQAFDRGSGMYISIFETRPYNTPYYVRGIIWVFGLILDTPIIYTFTTNKYHTQLPQNMKVSEMKKQLENLDDDIELKIIAPNAPPYITEFRIITVTEEE